MRICSEPDCGRPQHGQGLCSAHYQRHVTGSSRTGPIGSATITVDDDVYAPCPDQLLPLADTCAELDARAIVRTIWPHLIEASLAGLEPFTLDEAS